MNVAKGIKEIGVIFLGLLAMAAMLAIGVGFLVGATALSFWVLKWTPTAFGVTFAVSLFLLAPLSLIPPARGFAALGYLIASFAFGAIMWVWGVAFTYTAWGLFGLFMSVAFTGGTVVPAAMLAALLHADWYDLGEFAILAVLTYGCRMHGIWLGQRADERTARLAL